MANNSDYYKQYELNETLISFEKIPQSLAKEYHETNQVTMNL